MEKKGAWFVLCRGYKMVTVGPARAVTIIMPPYSTGFDAALAKYLDGYVTK